MSFPEWPPQGHIAELGLLTASTIVRKLENQDNVQKDFGIQKDTASATVHSKCMSRSCSVLIWLLTIQKSDQQDIKLAWEPQLQGES